MVGAARTTTITLLFVFVSTLAHAQFRNSLITPNERIFYGFALDGALVSDHGEIFLQRYYSSRKPAPGLFGLGWCSPWDQSLKLIDGLPVSYQKCPSEPPIELKKAGSSWVSKTGLRITKESARFRLIDSNNHGTNFGKDGLIEEQLRNGKTVWRIKNRSQESFLIQGSVSGLPIKAHLNHKGRITSFQWKDKSATFQFRDEALSSSRNFWGNLTTYETTVTGLLEKVTYPDRTFEKVQYDQQKKVISYRDRWSCEQRIHQDSTERATIRETCGSKSSTYQVQKSLPLGLTRDAFGRVKIRSRNGQVSTYSYLDGQLRPFEVETRRNKNTSRWQYDYDRFGRPTKIKSQDIIITAAYDRGGELKMLRQRMVGTSRQEQVFHVRGPAHHKKPQNPRVLIRWMEGLSALEGP